MNEWMILSRNYVIWLNSRRKFRAPPICSQSQKVSPVFSYCLLSESPSRSSILWLYLVFLRILKVASPLLGVLADRERNNWIITILPFIQGQWPILIQWKWGNVGWLMNYLRVWNILIHLPAGFGLISVSPPL